MTASQSGTGKVQDEPEQFCSTKKQNTLKKKKIGYVKRTKEENRTKTGHRSQPEEASIGQI